jgi:hypothetical protein
VFGGQGMSFNIRRGTLGTLAIFTAIRNASSHDSGPNRPPSCPLSEPYLPRAPATGAAVNFIGGSRFFFMVNLAEQSLELP